MLCPRDISEGLCGMGAREMWAGGSYGANAHGERRFDSGSSLFIVILRIDMGLERVTGNWNEIYLHLRITFKLAVRFEVSSYWSIISWA